MFSDEFQHSHKFPSSAGGFSLLIGKVQFFMCADEHKIIFVISHKESGSEISFRFSVFGAQHSGQQENRLCRLESLRKSNFFEQEDITGSTCSQ